MAHNFYLIGLIGNLGSGKSTVRQMLEQLGARGIDADALTHVVTRRGTRAWRAVVDAFGVDILMPDGRIDRRALAARVFKDAEALRTLEAIVHPAVGAMTKELLREATEPVVGLEAIKLIEAGMHHWCDALWAVTCTQEKQIERVMRTWNISQEEAHARIVAQGPLADKLALANVTIDNSGSSDVTRSQVEHEWKSILPETARDKSTWLWKIEWTESTPAVEAKSAATPEGIATSTQPQDTAAPAPTTRSTPASPVAHRSSASPEIPATEKPPIEIDIRRIRRSDLSALAAAIAKRESLPQPLSPKETLRRYGSGGYRIALVDGRIVAYVSWEAENLVATVNEVWAESSQVAQAVLPRLYALVEEEAIALLCEVVIVFLEITAPLHVGEETRAAGFNPIDLKGLHPVWQPIVREHLKPGERIWSKRLRDKLITEPV